MTRTHTPGPWEESGATIYCGKTIVAVAYCEGNRELHPSIDPSDKLPDADGEIGDGWEEAWSNARLIAAAPDLLAALEAIAKQADFSALAFPNATGRGDLLAIAQMAGDAIAMATGKGGA